MFTNRPASVSKGGRVPNSWITRNPLPSPIKLILVIGQSLATRDRCCSRERSRKARQVGWKVASILGTLLSSFFPSVRGGKKDIFRASKLSRLKVSRTTRFTLKLKGASSNFRLEAPFFRAAVPTSAPDVPPEEKKEKDGRRRGNEKRKQNYGSVGR